MKTTLRKHKTNIKNKSRYHKKYRSTHNTRNRRRNNRRVNKNNKHRKSFKHMKGGAPLWTGSPGDKVNQVSYQVGGPQGSARDTYDKHTDKPTGPTSYVNVTPQPLLDLIWGVQTNVKNFFNEFLGQPKEYTSSPIDQPLGKTVNPYIPTPITNSEFNQFKTSLLSKFNNN